MRLKMRRIGNSRGVILPWQVALRLGGDGLAREEPDGEELGEKQLELTLIGTTAVLTTDPPDELELQAALAYAAVKWRRRRLLERLARSERASESGPGPGEQ